MYVCKYFVIAYWLNLSNCVAWTSFNVHQYWLLFCEFWSYFHVFDFCVDFMHTCSELL